MEREDVAGTYQSPPSRFIVARQYCLALFLQPSAKISSSGMKRNFITYTLAAVCMTVLAALLHARTQEKQTDISGTYKCEVTPTGSRSNAHYDCVLSVPLSPAVFSHRDAPSGYSRTSGNGTRLMQKYSTDSFFKTGRPISTASTRSFQIALKTFPSGRLSEECSFILLRKLLI